MQLAGHTVLHVVFWRLIACHTMASKAGAFCAAQQSIHLRYQHMNAALDGITGLYDYECAMLMRQSCNKLALSHVTWTFCCAAKRAVPLSADERCAKCNRAAHPVLYVRLGCLKSLAVCSECKLPLPILSPIAS